MQCWLLKGVWHEIFNFFTNQFLPGPWVSYWTISRKFTDIKHRLKAVHISVNDTSNIFTQVSLLPTVSYRQCWDRWLSLDTDFFIDSVTPVINLPPVTITITSAIIWNLCNEISLSGPQIEHFRLYAFSWISFSWVLEYTMGAILNFYENLRRYSKVKINHRWQPHRR
jgi:hypothetical protein